MKEIWKDIPGYEGNYQVSTLGRIKSLNRKKYIEKNKGYGIFKEKILINHFRGKYLKVSLCKRGIIEQYSVHRLVAQVFILNTDNKPQVNHKNGIKYDNRVENLEWVTKSENELHKYQVLGYIIYNKGIGKKINGMGYTEWSKKTGKSMYAFYQIATKEAYTKIIRTKS